MNETSRTSQELLEENSALKQKIRALEKADSERRQTEEELRESEKLYTRLIATMPDIVVRMDLNGQILFVNDFGLRLSGYTSAEVLGQNMLSFIASDDREKAVRNLMLMLERRLEPQEYHLIMKDGRRIMFEVNGEVLRNEDGAPYGLVQICRDITARKQAEEDLHKTEREKYAILDAMSEIVIYVDTDLNIILSNRATNQQFNMTLENLKGRHCYEVLHKLDSPCRICPVVKAIEIGEPQIVDDFSSYGKKWTLRAYPVRNKKDDIVGVVEIVTDITERKKAEEEKRRLEERLHTLVDTIPDLIWLKDADGVYLSCNRTFELFFGAEESEIVGKTDYDFVSKELADFFRDHDRKAMALGKPSSNEEWITFASDGHRALLETIKTPMHDPVGTLIGVLGIGRDITKRKRAEEALRESQQRLADIIDLLPDATMVIDKEEKVIAWNRAIEAMTGVKKEDMLGKGNKAYALPFYGERRPILIDLALHPDPEMEKFYTIIQREGDILFGEAYTPNLPGGVAHLSATASVLRDSSGEIVAAIECVRDNTQRKETEAALRDSERRLSDIISFLPDATMVINRDGKLIAWNKAIEEMTGVKKEEMLGKGNYEYAIPFYGERRPVLVDLVLQPKEEIQEKYRNVKYQGDVLIGEAYIPDFRGDAVYLLGTASPLYDAKGVIVGAIETIRDITDHRQMEAALASEHARLSAILDGIPIPAFMIDLNHTVVLWNKNNEIYTGKTKEEMLDKALDMSFLHKDKTPLSLAELVLEMTDEELTRKYSSRGVRKSDVFPEAFSSVRTIFLRGEERTMSIQAARIFNRQGKIIGAVQTAQDITESIRIQREQEKLQSQLIQAQKMEAIGTLAGGIAHDFNNILTGIIGYTELYKDEVRDRPKVYHGMEQVLNAANRARDLVKHILTFSRKSEQEKKPFILAPMVKEVVKFMRASLPTTIEIKQTVDETTDAIMANPTQMHQVLMNLCTNAGHAMKDTGGVLEIGLKEVVIEAENITHHQALEAGHYLELSVRDTGHGISQENLGKIFDPYFTTKEMGEGAGLGLAVVHGIVKEHGGEIKVYSELNKGAIFRVCLPLMKKQMESNADAEKRIFRGKGETILFIDDEKMVVDLNKELLEKLGYNVVTETDPIKAAEIFRENSDTFDLVITDKTMPKVTGFEVAREAKSIRAGIPIILCSGFQEKEDTEKLAALGITLLIKPISMSEMARAIRDALDQKQI